MSSVSRSRVQDARLPSPKPMHSTRCYLIFWSARCRGIGLTANSFTSVSLDPPLLLVCLARTSNSLPILEKRENFAVNVLHIGQQPTSTLFARKDEERFTLTPCENWETGVPII